MLDTEFGLLMDNLCQILSLKTSKGRYRCCSIYSA